MRKSLLATLIVAASVMAAPAFAQMHIGAQAQQKAAAAVQPAPVYKATAATTANAMQQTQRNDDQATRQLERKNQKMSAHAAAKARQAEAGNRAGLAVSSTAAARAPTAMETARSNTQVKADASAQGSTKARAQVHAEQKVDANGHR